MKNKFKDFTFIVAVKGKPRVKNKNIRRFGDSSLVEMKLKQIRRIYNDARILLSSDCPKSIKLGKKYKAIIDKRDKNIVAIVYQCLLYISI